MTSKVEQKLTTNPFDKLQVIYVGSYKDENVTKKAVYKELVDQYDAKDIYQDIVDMKITREDLETYVSEHSLPNFSELGDRYNVSVSKVDDYAIHAIFWDNIEEAFNPEKSLKTNVEALVDIAQDKTSIDDLLEYAELNVSEYIEADEEESYLYQRIGY